MATNFRKFPDGGLGLVPRSSDPASPVNGDLQFSDGTARATGLWQYVSGAWAQFSGGTAKRTLMVRSTTNAGQNISSGGSVVIFEDETKDTSNAYNPATGNFTAPWTGFFVVAVNIKFTNTSWTATNSAAFDIVVAGSSVYRHVFKIQANYSDTLAVVGSAVVYLTSGQAMNIEASQTQTANVALAAITNDNTLTIFGYEE